MDVLEDRPWLDAHQQILTRSHLWRPDQVGEIVASVLARLGVGATIWLIDHEQRSLRALPVPGQDTPAPVPVDGTVAGRAFAIVDAVPTRTGYWVPMVNGTDRLGVVEFVLPPGADPATPPLQERCVVFAGLIGHLITTCEPRGDHLHRARRSQPMSTASELLWQLLQPLTVSCEELTVCAVLEPCYAVGGDGYDYAIDSSLARMAILDGVGKGLSAGLCTAVALAALRASRRAGADLIGAARAADAVLLEQFADARFVTAFLAELDMATGRLRYLNAGHPPPVVLRDGAAVAELTGRGRMPLGLDDPQAEIAEFRLQPGDRLLMYTDGITEARDSAGEQFGRDRLVELAEHHAAARLPASETVRRLSHAVIDHQHGPPDDDATLILADWSPAAARRTVP
jgi:sigma-B regulation protein RsbU (phosphoserine phosphatase)